MVYEKILVPYDGSKPSDKALEHAIQLAKSFRKDAKLVLLHIVPSISVPPGFGTVSYTLRSRKTGKTLTMKEYLKELYYEMKREAMKMLSEKKQKCESVGISTEIKILIGYPTDKIIEFANEGKVDLIVIGTTGLSGISRIKAVGSVARSVSEKSSCPVLLVR